MRVLIIAALLFMQSHQGDDAPEYPGQPMHCDNFKQTPEAHRCHCARDHQKCDGLPQAPEDVAMDKRCLTYCRKQNCQCAGHGCRIVKRHTKAQRLRSLCSREGLA